MSRRQTYNPSTGKDDQDIIMPRRSYMRRNRKQQPKHYNNDSGDNSGDNNGEFENLISKIPQTNEEKTIETAQWTWESKIWIGLICLIIVILACLIFWFMWKPEEVKAKHKNPPGMHGNHFPRGNARVNPAHRQTAQTPGQNPSNETSRGTRKNRDKEGKMDKMEKHKALQERMKARRARKMKKGKKKKIGQVPGIKPDNPEVLGNKPRKSGRLVAKSQPKSMGKIKEKIEEEYDLVVNENLDAEIDTENGMDIFPEDIDPEAEAMSSLENEISVSVEDF